jgi:serine/threonine protein kinase
MLKGTEAGRLVALREISRSPEGLAPAIDVARSLAHPQIAKVLGFVHTDANTYVASEYVPGVSLFELGAAVRKQGTQLKAATAVRIVRDALTSVATAQRLLQQTATVGYTRSFFADAIWIAEYGEVLVAEVGIAQLLSDMRPSRTETEAIARDILTAGVELFQLLSGQLMTVDATAKLAEYFPAPLSALLDRALKTPESFDGPAGFAAAMTELPQTLLGSEQQVADEVRRIMRPTLETRRHTLSALQQSSVEVTDEESTQFFRASGTIESTTRDTARPPPDLSSSPVQEHSGLRPSQGASSEEQDEPTTMFRSNLPPMPVFAAPEPAPAEPSAWQDHATRVDRTPSSSWPAASESGSAKPPRRAMRWLLYSILALVLVAMALALLQPKWARNFLLAHGLALQLPGHR